MMDHDSQSEHADGASTRPGPGQMSMDDYLDGLAQTADGTAVPVSQTTSYDHELEAMAALAGAEEPRPPEEPTDGSERRVLLKI